MINDRKCGLDPFLVFVEDLFKGKLDWIGEGINIVNEAFGVNATVQTDIVGNAQYVPCGVEASNRNG